MTPTHVQIVEHDLYQLRRAVREYVNHFCQDCESDKPCNIRDAMLDLLTELVNDDVPVLQGLQE